MSSIVNNSKKKITQSELKRFMSEHKNKLTQKKIESPLAKYLENGQLTCIVCDCPIRNEALWSGHISSRLHRDKITAIKRKKIETKQKDVFVKPHPPDQTSTSKKRSASPIHKHEQKEHAPPKKLKGILKNPLKQEGPSLLPESAISSNNIPSDFFDENENKHIETKMEIDNPAQEEDNTEEQSDEKMEVSANKDDPLPEGFFDDPQLDAKARNIEYKDPIEEEWEKFQKEIREETTVSAQIISEDQDIATAERQLDEIDEQMRNWSRVLDMERKKEQVGKTFSKKQSLDQELEDSSSNEDDFDEYLDWRSKRSFK